MSQEKNQPPPIENEPLPNNGKNTMKIELPNEEKKEIELVIRNDKVVSQTKANYAPEIISKKKIYRSTDDYHGTDCGCGDFRPHWLQRFRSPKMFLLIFSFLGILRAAYFTYTIACLSTIEKRYAFPSRISAIILICDNISGLLLNPIVGYLGTRVNGPKLIGFGCLLIAISSIMSGTPYFIYGTSEKLLASSSVEPSAFLSSLNSTQDKTKFEYCDSQTENCADNPNAFNIGAFLILAGASFLNGIGYTSFWTIGLPYLDDNTTKGNSPIYISISTVIRMLGVTLGYFLSSFCLSYYENPFLKVNIKTNDPRWIGMWYAGFLLLGLLFFIFSIPIFFFPASMKKPKKKGTDELSLRDALTILNRLVRNPILVFDAIGGALKSIGFAGYWINKPRYIEAQYSMSASKSSFLTGATSITMKAVGILAGGVFMAKFKPRPKILLLLIIAVELLCNGIFVSAMFFGCESPKFEHISYSEKKFVGLECNLDCSCGQQTFQPVCDSDGRTNYFSPCFAGCTANYTRYNNETKITTFENCACDPSNVMTSGYCKPPEQEQCHNLPYYLILMSTAGIVSSFARTPNVMIAIRSVDKEDKSFAFGMVGSFLSIFAYIPYPIIFGFVTDAACIIWEKTCGKSGNCWLYDLDKLRVYLHSTAFCFLMLGAVFDVLIYFYADRLNLYEEDDDDDFEPEKPIENGDRHEMTIHNNKLESIEGTHVVHKVSKC